MEKNTKPNRTQASRNCRRGYSSWPRYTNCRRENGEYIWVRAGDCFTADDGSIKQLTMTYGSVVQTETANCVVAGGTQKHTMSFAGLQFKPLIDQPNTKPQAKLLESRPAGR